MPATRLSFFRSSILFFLPLVVVAALIFAARDRHDRQLAALEHELAIARELRDGASVVEAARRLLERDPAPPRRVEFARALLDVRRFRELVRELDELRDADPVSRAAAYELAALAVREEGGEPKAEFVAWEDFLAQPAVMPERRRHALQREVELLEELDQRDLARDRAGELVALTDDAGTRLIRARVAVWRSDWGTVRADFDFVRANFSADPDVKRLLPSWERVTRLLPEVSSGAPTEPSFDHAAVVARAGLWRNAVRELRAVTVRTPDALAPLVLGFWMEGRDPNSAVVLARPWLASTGELAAFDQRSAERWARLSELFTVDGAFAAHVAAQGATDRRDALLGQRADLLCDLGQPRLALEELRPAIRDGKAAPPVAWVGVRAMLESGQTVDAAALLDRCLQTDWLESFRPGAKWLRLAGRVRQAQGRYADAAEQYTAALRLGPTAELHRARAACLRFLQRFSEAEQDLESAERLELAASTKEVSS